MRSIRLFAILILLGLLWGATIPLTKLAVSTGHHPLGLIVWQLLISVVVLSTFCLFKRLKPSLSLGKLIFFVIVAVTGTILPNSISYYAAAQLPAGVMAIVIASVPMFALMIALLWRLETFSLFRMCGVALGIGAIILLIGPQASLPDPTKAVFVLVALLSPFCYGLEGNYIETQKSHHTDPVLTILGASFIGFLIVLPIAFVTDTWVDLRGPWQAAEIALISSSLIHAFVYVCYVWLVSVTGAVFACQVAYIVTISGVLYSALFLNESYSGWVWVSLLLMIGGLVLVQPRKVQSENLKSGVEL